MTHPHLIQVEVFQENARLVRLDGADPRHPMSQEMAEGEARYLESIAQRWQERYDREEKQ